MLPKHVHSILIPYLLLIVHLASAHYSHVLLPHRASSQATDEHLDDDPLAAAPDNLTHHTESDSFLDGRNSAEHKSSGTSGNHMVRQPNPFPRPVIIEEASGRRLDPLDVETYRCLCDIDEHKGGKRRAHTL